MPPAYDTSDAALTERIAADLPELIALRHDLHANPQLAYEETYASGRVRDELARVGIPFVADLAGGTGVVGWITPDDPEAAGRDAVALRADMDALPIEERTGLAYASKRSGVMHACGHDGHTTMLLGAARRLAELRNALRRPVKLLFQPAEEYGGGAARMIEDGALGPGVGGVRVDRVFGLHGWPSIDLGRAATRTGPLFASTDRFYITVRGRGGHAASPHLTADPILAAAHIVTALQSVVSRNVTPTAPAVVTVAIIEAGTAHNIIPEAATMVGTVRAIDDATRTLLHRRVEQVARDTAAGLGCTAEVEIEIGYPVLVNDEAATAAALAAARRTLGDGRALTADQPVMAAEDFAFYGDHAPTCFALLGLRPPDRPDYPDLHTPRFDFNDDAIPLGVRLLCRFALDSDGIAEPGAPGPMDAEEGR